MTVNPPIKNILVVYEDTEGSLSTGWNDMHDGELLILAEFAKARAIKHFYK